MRYQKLESRRLLAATLDASDRSEFQEIETDPLVIAMFHGPVIPGRPIGPIQGVATKSGDPEVLEDDFPVESDPSAPLSSQGALFATDQTFKLHSRPNSNFTIYLDFDGHTTIGTSWNSGYGIPVIEHPNYWGETGSNFSSARLELIQQIWQIVAEDFAAFDVDVTTEEPADLDDLRYNGPQDTRWGTRAVMTKDTFAKCKCGGHAYIGAFDDAQDEPALIYNGGVNAGSETVSHEVGHQLGLNHDGVGSTTYYGGHGTGATGWGPIMGSPFSKQVTQWSKGDYFNASQTTQDDLAVITRSVNFPYAPDDHANDRAMATPLREVGTTTVEAFGIIETNDDVDWFEFSTGGGNISLAVDVLGNKPNLDVWVGLYDSEGEFIVDSNPQASLSASLENLALSPGTYFLKVDGVPRDGTYDPQLATIVEPSPAPYTVAGPLGYSDYGSLGQFRISGTIVDQGLPTISIVATTASVSEGASAEFTLLSSDGSSGDVTVEVRSVRQDAPGLSAPHSAEPEDFGGPLTEIVSIVDGIGSFQVPLVHDGKIEANEMFEVVITDSGPYAVADRVAKMWVEESDTLFAIAATEASSDEGNPPGGAIHQFAIERLGSTALANTIGWRRVYDGNTPADDLDFTSPSSGIIVFDVGETTHTLDMNVQGDLDYESDENYRIEIFVPTGQFFQVDSNQNSAEGWINNDDILQTDIQLFGGDHQPILNGDLSVSANNGTDFGWVEVDSDSRSQIYTIENHGVVDRELSLTLVDGTAESDFSITRFPEPLIAPGGSSTFEVTFDPNQPGLRSASVVIQSSDPEEPDFTFNVAGQSTDLRVQQVQINAGHPSRSQLESVNVIFNQTIQHQSIYGAFEVRNLTTDQTVTAVTATPTDINGRTEVLLTFESRNTGAVILEDGNYELRVRSGTVVSAGIQSYPMLSDYRFGTEAGMVDPADAFFRFFGDTDGDRDVDGQDYGTFALTFMQDSNSENYARQLDVDGDGDVDGLDFGQFRQRLLKVRLAK